MCLSTILQSIKHPNLGSKCGGALSQPSQLNGIAGFYKASPLKGKEHKNPKEVVICVSRSSIRLDISDEKRLEETTVLCKSESIESQFRQKNPTIFGNITLYFEQERDRIPKENLRVII